MVTQTEEAEAPGATRHKLSLEDINRSKISRDTGLTMSHCSRIFNGLRRPSLNAARMIAQSLGVSIDELDELLDSIVIEKMPRLTRRTKTTAA